MRDRHFPRLCGHCHAPMSRQEDTCWRCGTRWASEDQPSPVLHAVSAGTPEEALLQTGRWVDEGGSLERAV
jgi:predicted amidophosphoribosyltransferase